jgi:hypothetical protein
MKKARKSNDNHRRLSLFMARSMEHKENTIVGLSMVSIDP